MGLLVPFTRTFCMGCMGWHGLLGAVCRGVGIPCGLYCPWVSASPSLAWGSRGGAAWVVKMPMRLMRCWLLPQRKRRTPCLHTHRGQQTSWLSIQDSE